MLKFMEAKELLMTKFKYKPSDMKDFDPAEEERRIAREKAEATAARKAARAVRKMERAQRNAVL